MPREASAKQSGAILNTMQSIAQETSPNSNVATATDANYDWLHYLVRKSAHFIEYAVLGALLCACYLSYTNKWGKFWLPTLGIMVVPAIDETIQRFIPERFGNFGDVMLDFGGGVFGITVVLGIFLLLVWRGKRRQRALKATPCQNIVEEEGENAGEEPGNCAD